MFRNIPIVVFFHLLHYLILVLSSICKLNKFEMYKMIYIETNR